MSVGIRSALCLALVSVALPSCTEPRKTHERLHGVLWMQTAAEYAAASEQCYNLAGSRLDEALSDSSWSAAVEQEGDYETLPPAVILDIDETVLDNSAFMAQLVRNDTDFDRTVWDRWVGRAEAEPLPGALEFIDRARSKGVRVFFVTNRLKDAEPSTRRNLRRLGVALDSDTDTLLTRNDRPGWGSDKRSRRRYIARDHRVLLLIGDNLNDFVSGAKTTPEDRRRLAMEYRSFWGSKWILLPNPLYGSWEGALYGFDYDLTDSEKLRRKYSWIEAFEKPTP